MAEYNGSGSMLRRYVHGDGNDDPLFGFEGPGLDQPRFPYADRHGSVIAVSGPGGAVLAINTYDEYGIPGAPQRPATALGTHGRFQYTGQAWLPELGMYHYKARIYSPVLGRFLQVDPIGYDGGINLYNYADVDPLNYTDPSGNHPVVVALGIRCALNAGCRTAVGNGIRAVGNGLRRLAPAVRVVPPDRVLNESKPQEHGPRPLTDGERQALADAGKAPDQGGRTAAGRAGEKHGSRPGSAFPPTKGPPSAINAQGQKTLEGIVRNPDSTVQVDDRGRTTVIAPDGRGARFNPDGSLQGLREPTPN
jgi:RHS repeat-associated protein